MLKDKVFVITGGARGIGFSVYSSCIRQGAKAVICSRNIDEVEKAIKEVDTSGSRSIGLKVDVSVALEVENMIKVAMEKFGKIDGFLRDVGFFVSYLFAIDVK